jgi:hypothetical protein
VHGVGYPGTPARPEFSLECSLPVVWPDFHAACDRRIGSEVLLHGTPATILDRGASLDDAGDRGGSTLGRLPEGVSHERARCRRGVPVVEITLIAGAYWAIGSESEISRPDACWQRIHSGYADRVSRRNDSTSYQATIPTRVAGIRSRLGKAQVADRRTHMRCCGNIARERHPDRCWDGAS